MTPSAKPFLARARGEKPSDRHHAQGAPGLPPPRTTPEPLVARCNEDEYHRLEKRKARRRAPRTLTTPSPDTIRAIALATTTIDHLRCNEFTVRRSVLPKSILLKANHPPRGIRLRASFPKTEGPDPTRWKVNLEFSVARLVRGDNRIPCTTTDIEKGLAAVARLVGRDVRWMKLVRVDIAAQIGIPFGEVKAALKCARHRSMKHPPHEKENSLTWGLTKTRRGIQVCIYDPEAKRRKKSLGRIRLEIRLYGAKALRRWLGSNDVGALTAHRLTTTWARVIEGFPAPRKASRKARRRANKRLHAARRDKTGTKYPTRRVRDDQSLLTRHELWKIGLDFQEIAEQARRLSRCTETG